MRLGLSKLSALIAAAALSLGAAPASGPDTISFELNSWGRLLERWTLNADGSGELITTSNKPDGGLGDDVRILQKLGPDPARFRRLSEILRPARAFAGRELPCGERTFDLPYGEISWGHAGTVRSLRFDSGCSSARARAVLASLKAANELVGQWAADAPKVEIAGSQPPG